MKNTSATVFKWLIFGLLILYTVSLFIPIGWGLLTSFKSAEDFRLNVFGFPKPFTFENYASAFERFAVVTHDTAGDLVRVRLPMMTLYSVLYAVGCAFFATTTAFVTAYATAKFSSFKLSKVIYTIVVVTMVLPIVGNLPAEINMAQTLGFYKQMWGIWLMKANFLGMYFLVFHATFSKLPVDFSEAAYLDGASEFTVMLRIYFPLALYPYLTVFLLNFINFWNDYQVPLVYIPNYPTLAQGVFTFSNTSDTLYSSVPMKIMGCVILLLPILVLFLAFHKRLIGNLSMGGLKE